MASLQKFFDRRESNGKPLFWGRASSDGAPFRGAPPPLLTEDEFEQRVVRTADVRAAFFNVAIEDEKRAYLDVLDGVANGWFRLVYRKMFYRRKPPVHYVEWVEFYLEDGAPARAVPSGDPGMGVVNVR